MNLQSSKLISANDIRSGLVHDSKDNNDVLPFRLREKFGEDTNIVEDALCIGIPHSAPEEIDLSVLSGMIIT